MVKNSMPLTYCGNIVRQQDSDRFLLSLFAPAKHRAALWALFAFNIEIAKTRYVVSETTIGQIRLQWWREAIAEIYDGKVARAHEVVSALAQVIKAYDLPQEWFNDLIYAREFDLEGLAPETFDGLMKYCEMTHAPLLRMVSKILGYEINDTDVVDSAIYYSFIGTVRSVPYMLSQGFVLLPKDVLSEFSLNPKNLIDFNKKEEIHQIIKELFSRYDKFRNGDFQRNKSKFLRKVNRMTFLYEKQIKSLDGDVFNDRLHITPKFMALRLWIGA